MNFAIPDCDVTGPKVPVVPVLSVTTRWIVRVDVIVSVFRFIDAVAMNTIATAVGFLPGTVGVIGVWKNVEPIDDDPAREVEANVIKNYAMPGLGANCEWVLWIISI